MVNRDAQDILKRSESLQLMAYLCPAGVPSIGYGHTKTVTADDVRRRKRISAAVADGLLAADLAEFEAGVLALCRVAPNENQLGAMVCLAFNIGLAGFAKSSVLKAHNRGDFESAARAFCLWNKATVGGKKVVLPGLVSRRAAEAALYLKPVEGHKAETLPQSVEPERPMSESAIVRGGAVTAGASGLTLASEAARSVADIRYSLGDWLPYIALAVALLAAGYVVWERFNQRKRGQA
jgi:lysozyme